MYSSDGIGSDIIVKVITIILIIFIVGAMATFIFMSDGKREDHLMITLYGFSVKGEVFEESIIPSFREYWKNMTGEEVFFETTYAGSGRITNQVIAGAPAEVMVLSTEWDAIQLERNGLVETDWRSFPYNGTVSRSPWVILVREGNPKGITDFEDLAMDGIELVHADPLTSGGACWSVFSVYGSELRRSEVKDGYRNTTAARELLQGLMGNVISWQSSARKALSQFALGYGDALITYENDALLAMEKGEPVEVIYPSSTIYSEHKAVIIDKNINEDEREVIDAFMDFLQGNVSQRAFVEYNFRSVQEELNDMNPDLPDVEDPFTVDYLGGWEAARTGLIDGLFQDLKG